MNELLPSAKQPADNPLSFRDKQIAECVCEMLQVPLPSSIQDLSIEDQARHHLASNCPYAFCFKDIQFEFAAGVLTLRGRLPSFYLKQILQTWLSSLQGVRQIKNQVNVVSATGRSSQPELEFLDQ